MTLRRVYVGSLGPHQYYDDEAIGDPDENFAGELQYALATDGDILADDIYADEVIVNILRTGGLVVGIRTVSGDFAISGKTDAIILVDTNEGIIEVTLPSVSAYLGRIFWIKNIGIKKNAVELKGYSSDLVEGELTQYLRDGDTVAIAAGPSQWRFI